MRILLVEDSFFIQRGVSHILSQLGHTVDIAGDGLKALEMYKNGYSLIILDYGLPVLNGVQVCGAIRAYEHMADSPRVPIIGMSVLAGMIRHKAVEIGFDEVHEKITDIKTFIEILDRYDQMEVDLPTVQRELFDVDPETKELLGSRNRADTQSNAIRDPKKD